MTQQEKDELNKELCGLLGINPKILSVMGGMMWEYPDFTSEVGRVQLLKLMMKRDTTEEVENKKSIYDFFDSLDYNVGHDYHFCNGYLLDDDGAFAIAARDFLKAMEGK